MPADFTKTREALDAWGNPYLEATVTFGKHTSSYIFSAGPDGVSKTGGNDPDDITIWTGEYEWLNSQNPNRWISVVAAVISFFVSALSGGALMTRRRYRTTA